MHNHQKQDQPQVPLTKDYSEGFESGLQRHHEAIVIIKKIIFSCSRQNKTSSKLDCWFLNSKLDQRGMKKNKKRLNLHAINSAFDLLL